MLVSLNEKGFSDVDFENVLILLGASGNELPNLSKKTILDLVTQLTGSEYGYDGINLAESILTAQSLHHPELGDRVDPALVHDTLEYTHRFYRDFPLGEDGSNSEFPNLWPLDINFIIAHSRARGLEYDQIVMMMRKLNEKGAIIGFYRDPELRKYNLSNESRKVYLLSNRVQSGRERVLSMPYVYWDVYRVATEGTPENIDPLLSEILQHDHWQTVYEMVRDKLK